VRVYPPAKQASSSGGQGGEGGEEIAFKRDLVKGQIPHGAVFGGPEKPENSTLRCF
jgi:hypothetical protein